SQFMASFAGIQGFPGRKAGCGNWASDTLRVASLVRCTMLTDFLTGRVRAPRNRKIVHVLRKRCSMKRRWILRVCRGVVDEGALLAAGLADHARAGMLGKRGRPGKLPKEERGPLRPSGPLGQNRRAPPGFGQAGFGEINPGGSWA